MITITSTIRAHFDQMVVDKEVHQKSTLAAAGPFEQWADLYSQLDTTFTMFHKHDIIAIGGIVPLWPGVGEAWLLRGEKFNDVGFSAAKNVKKFLNEIVEEQGYHRVQAGIIADDFIAQRWADFLGLTDERFLMKQYGPDGKDYYMMARII
jgi:hypothetical protein